MNGTDAGHDFEGGLRTRFASPGRLHGHELTADLALAAGSPVVGALLCSLGTAAFVLNGHRQILAANTAALETVGGQETTRLLGLRPGEVLGCVHAHEEEGGCGTAPACATCGAVLAVLVALKRGRPEERRCALTVRTATGTADLDLRVRAVPFEVDGQELVMVAVSDVSQQDRQAALEHAFLHDVANVLAGLSSAARTIDSPDPDEAASAVADVRLLTDRLVREVQVQRALGRSDLDDYRPEIVEVSTARLCEDLVRLFRRHPLTARRHLELTRPERDAVRSDPFLLTRILTGMLENAFEATPAGGKVLLAVRDLGGAVSLEVHNAGAIPAAVAPRIFQRHFTTKTGSGRGVGTWTMKALGERLLRGEVGFQSHRVAGTTFWLRLPDAPRPSPAAPA
jgi:signal transduction histidine kinase